MHSESFLNTFDLFKNIVCELLSLKIFSKLISQIQFKEEYSQ